MMTWIKRLGSIGKHRDRIEPRAPTKPPAFAVSAEYLPLHTYLRDRYANTVVLTFDEVEDLIGFKLPALARVEKEWWADADDDGVPSAQARAWTEANRTATANLLAHNVVFERASA